MALSHHTEALWRDAERALAYRRPEAAMPLLQRLIRTAPARSEPWGWAHVQLAAHVVETDPWQAALWARRAVTVRPDDDRAWAVLGLACSLLGHHRAAAHAYERALRLAPYDARCAHNLGHLLDVVFDDPREALPLLRRATELLAPEEGSRVWQETTASLAHALLRAGAVEEAYHCMLPVVRDRPTPTHHRLYQAILERRRALLDRVAAATPPPSRRAVRRRVRTRPTRPTIVDET